MKLAISICIAFAAIALAQTPPPAAPAPGAAAPPAPDTVIAEYDNGKKLTYGELDKFLSVLPKNQRDGVMRDRKRLVEQYLLMKKLAEIAEKDKLDQRSPYKEAIEFNRMNTLTQAEVQKVSSEVPVRVEEQQAYYEQHKDKYEQVTVKLIYISFSSSGGAAADGKKRLTEAEAKTKAEQIAKDAKGGADFVKLVQENSEDSTTKAKNGDLTISRAESATLPESIRTAALALKPGEVSDPVRQPNGFYVFRGESVNSKPFAEVKDQIFTDLQRLKTQDFMNSTTKDLNIKLENDQFF